MVIEEKEKEIYNTYLRISRSMADKPFRYRKDWTDFEKKAEIVDVKKINNFLKRNPQISLEDYITAPYEIFGKNETFPLSFYATQPAIKVYVQYLKKSDIENIDSERNYKFAQDSLLFFFKYCRENNINSYQDYFSNKKLGFYKYIEHYKNRQIIIYLLLMIGLEEQYWKLPISERKFYFPDFETQLIRMKNNLMLSKKTKPLLEQGLKKIIEKFLANTK